MQSHVGTAFILAKPIGWRRSKAPQTFVSARFFSGQLVTIKLMIVTVKLMKVDGS